MAPVPVSPALHPMQSQTDQYDSHQQRRTHTHTHLKIYTHALKDTHTRICQTHHMIQVNGSLQQTTTFDHLEDDLMIQIARFVPLESTNLSQLNCRAKRLQLSDYQPMSYSKCLMNSIDAQRCVYAALPQHR